jgi:hypothetical protein
LRKAQTTECMEKIFLMILSNAIDGGTKKEMVVKVLELNDKTVKKFYKVM